MIYLVVVAAALLVEPPVVVPIVVLAVVRRLDVLVVAPELLAKYEEMEGREMLDDHETTQPQDSVFPEILLMTKK